MSLVFFIILIVLIVVAFGAAPTGHPLPGGNLIGILLLLLLVILLVYAFSGIADL